MEDELSTHIAIVESPVGGEAHDRMRQRSTAWLLDHADSAHPVILRRVREGRAGPAIIALLGDFGRAESVPALASLVSEQEPVGSAAARALARHPADSALAALRAGVRTDGDVAVRCADALGMRGDASVCPDLLAALAHRDARVRYHVIQAAVAIHCLGSAELQEIQASDPDPEVRTLALRLAAGG